jgi:hypothetical protein
LQVAYVQAITEDLVVTLTCKGRSDRSAQETNDSFGAENLKAVQAYWEMVRGMIGKEMFRHFLSESRRPFIRHDKAAHLPILA